MAAIFIHGVHIRFDVSEGSFQFFCWVAVHWQLFCSVSVSFSSHCGSVVSAGGLVSGWGAALFLCADCFLGCCRVLGFGCFDLVQVMLFGIKFVGVFRFCFLGLCFFVAVSVCFPVSFAPSIVVEPGKLGFYIRAGVLLMLP